MPDNQASLQPMPCASAYRAINLWCLYVKTRPAKVVKATP